MSAVEVEDGERLEHVADLDLLEGQRQGGVAIDAALTLEVADPVVTGRDLREDDCKKLFGDLACREQVFWLTMPGSGWFLRSLSAKGRIVITATAADEEYNETEFPQALATVCGRNKDGKVSVLELYQQTVAEVQARFAGDKRVPTEHAQLDDNGDGVGTEEPILKGTGATKKATADGPVAARTFLPFKKKAKN